MRTSLKHWYGATLAIAMLVAPHVSAADNGVALLPTQLTEAEDDVSNAFVNRSLESVISQSGLSQIGCDSCCGDGCCGDGCCGGGGCTDSCTGCGCGLDFGGWLAWGVYDNSHGLEGPAAQTPLGFNNIGEEWQMHQAWAYLGKKANNGGSGIAFGFRADFMFGTDGQDTVAFGDRGWDASWATSNNYSFAFPQLYGEVAIGNTSVIMGHFFTIIGYEVVQAPNNFFYSHAYTMYYNEPFTHTGILASTPLGQNINVFYGWTSGWDSGFENRREGSTALGGLGVTVTDDLTVNWGLSFGDPGDVDGATSDTFLSSLVVDWNVTDNIEYIAWSDYQTRQTTGAVAPETAWKQYGLVQYLLLNFTDVLRGGMRYEWFYAGAGTGGPLNTDMPGNTGLHYHALTWGLNWTRGNCIFKPECRYDWVDSDGGYAPFAGNTKMSQFTWGMQGIATF